MTMIMKIILALLPTILVGGFIAYLIWDIWKFRKKLDKNRIGWENELKKKRDTFLKSQKKLIPEIINKAMGKVKVRVDLLSRENNKLREENEHLREKLKNMGFSDEQLKL